MLRLYFVLFFLCASVSAQSETLYRHPVTFGAEWTFSNDKLYKSFPVGPFTAPETPYSQAVLRALIQLVDRKLTFTYPDRTPPISVKSYHSHFDRIAYVIEYRPDLNVTIFTDPGVFEVNTSPLTASQIHSYLDIFQKDIFDSFADFDLLPQAFAGGGHIHIGVQNLKPLAIRNLIVDFFNHSGLFMGGLNHDIFNALAFSELPLYKKKSLGQYLDHQTFNFYEDIKNLISFLNANTYKVFRDQDPAGSKAKWQGNRAEKYHAVSFASYGTLETLEIRAIRPQQSARSYAKLVDLFQRRIDYIADLSEDGAVIPLQISTSLEGKPDLALQDMYNYITEVGLDFADFKEFVLPWWQNEGGEFDQFLAQKSPHFCQSLLEK